MASGAWFPASVKCQCLAQSVTGTSQETVGQREKTNLLYSHMVNLKRDRLDPELTCMGPGHAGSRRLQWTVCRTNHPLSMSPQEQRVLLSPEPGFIHKQGAGEPRGYQ